MYFDIIIIFPEKQAENSSELFQRSFQSLVTQNHTKWKLTVLGNATQIEQAHTVITTYNKIKNLENEIDLVKAKSYESLNLNLIWEYVFDNHTLPDENHKLIFLRVGDYFSTNYLDQSLDYLRRFELDKQPLEPILAFTDFKYLDSNNRVFPSNQIIGINLNNTKNIDFIFKPKLLCPPIQFFWDSNFIKHQEIRFDLSLESIELRFAKFTLDYILALSKQNSFLLPLPKLIPDGYFITSNPVVSQKYITNPISWASILSFKQEILQNFGLRVWWKYKLLSFFGKVLP